MPGIPESFAEGELGFGIAGTVRPHDARDGVGLWDGRSFVADVAD